MTRGWPPDDVAQGRVEEGKPPHPGLIPDWYRTGRAPAVAATDSSAILAAVEQPIGQNVTPTTTSAAGTDPAFIPGVPAQLDGAVPPALRGAGKPPAKAADTADAVEEPDTDSGADGGEPGAEDGTAATTDALGAAPPDDTADADDADDDAAIDDGKPVFEVSDRRASIAADRSGITFTLDSEIAEFGWDEIGAVEIDTPRFGKRFSVTVYTSSRRWFQSDVEATSRKQLKEWTAELDAVLDARFDGGTDADSDDAGEPDGADDAQKAAGSEPASSDEQRESADA